MVRKTAGYGSVLLCVYPDVDTLRRGCDEYGDDDSSKDEDVIMFPDDDPLDFHGDTQSRIHEDESDSCERLADSMQLDAEDDWAEILDNQPIVLNDRMMTDAMQSPHIQSEHSYSLTLNDELPQSPFGLAHNIKLEDYSKDMETECFPVVSITSATGQSDFPVEDILIKQEPPSPPPRIPSPTRSTATTISALLGAPSSPLHPQSLLKQPTIVLAKRPQQQQLPTSSLGSSFGLTARDLLYPKVKLESSLSTSGFPFPPTPPSYNGSDSDGSLSPVHSLRRPTPPPVSHGSGAPSSSSSSSGGAGSSRKGHAKVLLSVTSTKHASSSQTSLISSQPKGATGVLVLTEEEKRTLLAEGYPIPQKLPLTKAEERSLKKIRRKIKNKISAQESRRKKKEYMDALEKKVEILASENSDFKKKVDSLEGSNKSLLSQLQQLQAILESQMSHKRSRNAATQTFPSSTAVRQSESGRSSKTAELMDLSDAKAR